MIRHHPETELLLEYSAGGLAEPVALAVATHACYCPACRAEVARMETVGGVFLQDLDPAGMADDALDSVLAVLDRPETGADEQPPGIPAFDEQTLALIPSPLRPYLGGNMRDLRWRRQGFALREARLPNVKPGYRVSLFELKPGKHPPAHSHMGNEYIVVLSGSFSENGDQYSVGDFARADSTTSHIQIADMKEGCICLAVLDAPVELPGLIGGLVNPFLRF
jgi:putative transcriptional regulator